MENYSYTASYTESGESSPRSREVDFDNPLPWEEQPPSSATYKVKLMCSYGGKIHPRPHDNQLTYVGGETKILTVDRTVKFSGIISKLSALCDADVCFKYQLPGEDLDALISVTNDDDLDHMMHEYDRLFRATAKPARLRLFLFPVNLPPTPSSLASNDAKSDREQFMDALNCVPAPPSTVAPPSHMDFLFGLEKGMPPPPPLVAAEKLYDQIPVPVAPIPLPVHEDRGIRSDPIQKQTQDLQRLQFEHQEQANYQRKIDDHIAGGFNRDYYVQKMPENLLTPANMPGTVSLPPQYFPATTMGTDQQVYMIQAPAGMYHAPIGRPVTGPTGQGYYAVQRMPPDVYRDQQVYNVMAPPPSLPPQGPPQVAAYTTEGMGMGRPGDGGYAQVAYDNGIGRQVYYNAPGVVMPPQQYQGMAATGVNGEIRPAGTLTQEGKVVVAKVSQASV